VDAYLWFVLIGLGIASFVNLYQPRAMFLVFFAFLFIVIAGESLPDPDSIPDPLQGLWFPILAAIESSFALFALATRARQAYCVALFSGLMAIVHMWVYWRHGSIAPASYEFFIRCGEGSQVLALTLLSNPVLRFWAWYRSTPGGRDGGYKSVAVAG
jgi:hypothetical protein